MTDQLPGQFRLLPEWRAEPDLHGLEAGREWEDLLYRRLIHGAAKYGVDAWRRHDHLAEAADECLDLGNYCYLEWLRLTEVGRGHPAYDQVDVVRAELRRIYVEAFMTWQRVHVLRNRLADMGVAASITGEDRVGVRATLGGEAGNRPPPPPPPDHG